MRRLYLGGLVLLASMVSCVQIFGIEAAQTGYGGGSGSTGQGSTASSGTTTATSSSGGTGAQCQSNADCDVEHVCSSIGVCLLADGQSCATATPCDSAFCADGVCCNQACDTACHACTAALTGVVNGACAPAPNGAIDPRALCAVTAATTCGTTGTCSQGACTFWATTTLCGTVPMSCMTNGGAEFVDTKACNGSGACTPMGSVECGPDGCAMDQSSCACSKVTDCPTGFTVCSDEGECEL